MSPVNVSYPVSEIENVFRSHDLDPVELLTVVDPDDSFSAIVSRDENEALLKGCWSSPSVVSVAFSNEGIHYVIHGPSFVITVSRSSAADEFELAQIAVWRTAGGSEDQNCPPEVLDTSIRHFSLQDSATISEAFTMED